MFPQHPHSVRATPTAASTHKNDRLCFTLRSKDVSVVRIDPLERTGTVKRLCIVMGATGHADHPRAADLGEPRPDEPPRAHACHAASAPALRVVRTLGGNGGQQRLVIQHSVPLRGQGESH